MSRLLWTLRCTPPGAVAWAADLVWDGTVLQEPDDAREDEVASFSEGQPLEKHVAAVATRLGPEETSLPAAVPGTVAGALRDQGLSSAVAGSVDDHDWWWITQVSFQEGDTDSTWRLCLRGVATVSEIFWDGHRVGHSVSGLDDIVVEVMASPGEHELAIVCRAPALVPVPRRPRPRWRSTLVADSSWRWRRTPLIGRIPWAGTQPVVGPWGEVFFEPAPRSGVDVVGVRTSLLPGTAERGPVGGVHLSLRTSEQMIVTVSCGDVTSTHSLGPGDHDLEMTVPDPQPWWPATHGSPALHELVVAARTGRTGQLASRHEPVTVARKMIGFRTVEKDTSDGGFVLIVNGCRIFARGAVWTPVDALTLGNRPEEIDRTVRALCAAGANLLRVSGTHCWEPRAFYDACDRHGLLVWHDAMLATLDPPCATEWLSLVEAELRTWMPRLGAHPSIAVFSGGNEVLQQPVLWGRDLSALEIPVIEELIPRLCEQLMPHVVHVASSPSGGLPITRPDVGISHWFGVGAYRRPLSDARGSGVRFAAEALAFGVPPAPSEIREAFGSETADHDEAAIMNWSRTAARDPGAQWNFEDISVHYALRWLAPGMDSDTGASGSHGGVNRPSVGSLGASPQMVWSELSRAEQLHAERMAAARAVEHTVTELRRAASGCGGVVVLASRDLVPGAGWGVLDASGRPKSTWYALRRACSPTSINIVDDGLAGLHVHVFHDLQVPLSGTVLLRTWNSRSGPGPSGEFSIEMAGRGEVIQGVEDVLGGFLDLDHAWGFGDRQWEALEVELVLDGAARESHRAVRLLGAGHRDGTRDLRAGLALSNHLQGDQIDSVGKNSAPVHTVGQEVVSEVAAAAVSCDPGPGLVPEDDYFDVVPGWVVHSPAAVSVGQWPPEGKIHR